MKPYGDLYPEYVGNSFWMYLVPYGSYSDCESRCARSCASYTKEFSNVRDALYNSVSCDSGTYLPANTTTCVACPTGKSCQGGFFVPGSVDQGINGCTFGYYKSGDNCIACGANSSITYTTHSRTTCTCNTGYVSATGGSTSTSGCFAIVDTCEAGEYLPANTTTCTACPAGRVCTGGTFAMNTVDQGLAAGCAAGYYQSGNNCVACGANSSTTDNNTAATCTCNTGFTADGTENGANTSTTGCSLVPKFSVTTTNLADNSTFTFYMAAGGTFTVDCGENGTLSGTGVSGNTITRSASQTYYSQNNLNTRLGDTYTCTYTNGGVKTIKFDGLANAYNTSGANSTLSFINNTSVAAVDGDLSAIFPSSGSDDHQKPKFYETFKGCTSLTSVPATLFSGYTTNVATGMFTFTFRDCTGLTTVPAGLFSGITTAAGSMFDGTFYGCRGLTTIPAGLFSGITTGASNMFIYTFVDCTGLTTIPAGLFSGITTGADSLFRNTFDGCTGLTSIPSGLFSGITTGATQMFEYTFSGCTGLTSLPDSLFANITTGASSMFRWAFSGCTGLTGYVPPNLFAGLIANGSPYYANNDNLQNGMMRQIFENTGSLATTCPTGMAQYMTGYESYWDGHVSCKEAGNFTVTTTNLSAGADFKFKLSATGTFTVDCGTDGTLSGTGVSGNTITRNDTTQATYTCHYTSGGSKSVEFSGTATGYSTSTDATGAAISFTATPTLVKRIDGSVGSSFPTLNGGGSGKTPIFNEFCKGCNALEYIDENLFTGVTGAADSMFRSAFDRCTVLTTIPENLFATTSGSAPNMFRSLCYDCKGLTSLSAKLFRNIDGAEDSMFKYVFWRTSALSGKYIPAHMFDGLHGETATDLFAYAFQNSGLVTSCPSGTTQYVTGYEDSWDSKKSCQVSVTCAVGEYLPAYATTCTACPTGKYCAGGTFAENTMDQGITGCAAGYYQSAVDTCTACGANSSTVANNTAATCTCDSGYFSSAGESTSTNGCSSGITCAVGTYLPANATTCSACPTGKYCTGGTFAENTIDQGLTSNCAAGYYQSAADTCTACGANSTTENGNTAVTCACNAGYTVDGTVNGATTSTTGCSLPPFDLTDLDYTINGTTGFGKGTDTCGSCGVSASECSYVGCSNSAFSDLETGEWKTDFSYGTVYGETKCSVTGGDTGQSGNPSDTSGGYCWCKATKYTPSEGLQTSAKQPTDWVLHYVTPSSSEANCRSYCPSACALDVVKNTTNIRSEVYGFITCESGQYLPANTTTCTACPTGKYCTGGTFTEDTVDQGVTTNCVAGYYQSGNNCVACGANSSTEDNNESLTCTCNKYYTADGTVSGATTSVSGCTAVPVFDLTTLDTSITGTIGYSEGTTGCYQSTVTGTNIATASQSSSYCSDDLDAEEWKAEFSYGTVYGEGKCSSSNGVFAETGTPENTDGSYCWCGATGFKSGNNVIAPTKVTAWAFGSSYDSAALCHNECASACVGHVIARADFRPAEYGFITCATGTYLPANTTTCTACPTGRYCIGGTFAEDTVDQGLTTNCAAGYYKSGTYCVACGVNSSTTDNNESETCNCDSGYVSEEGENTSPSGCPMAVCSAGTYLPANETTCAACPIGSYCAGGIVDVENNESAQGLTGNCASIAIGWTSAANSDSINDCYYPVTLNKNGFSGTIAAGAGTGCSVASAASGTDNAILNIFYNTACTLPVVELTQTGLENATGWAATNAMGATAVTSIAAMTESPVVTTYYANKTGCGAGYYLSEGTCTACGANSSTVANNTATTCTCNTGYTANGRENGSTTSTSGCLSSSKFSVTTTNLSAGATFSFQISAAGTFTVDCGEDGVLSGTGVDDGTIDRTGNTTAAIYTCTYSTGGEKTIKFGGSATGYGYVTSDTEPATTDAAISFGAGTPALVKTMTGSLGDIFPTLGTGNQRQSPLFYGLCQECSNLTSIPESLFENVTAPANSMFRSAFDKCSKLATIPAGLFADLDGSAPNMFRSTFYECYALSDIPAHLFDGINGAAKAMFKFTFKGVGTTALNDKYIPAHLFDGLNRETATELFYSTFNQSGLLTQCPEGTDQYITGYESSWNNKVACEPLVSLVCPGDTYRDVNVCLACPAGYTYNNTVGKESIDECQMHCNAGQWTGEYTQLEYIQGSGTEYINTGYMFDAGTPMSDINIKIEIDVSMDQPADNLEGKDVGNFFGNVDTTNGFSANYKGGVFGLWVAKPGNGTKLQSASNLHFGETDAVSNIVYTIKDQSRTMTINGTPKNGTFEGTIVSTNPFRLFSNGCAGGCGDNMYIGRIHSFKMYRATDANSTDYALVFDMIPARRESDGAIGMFDRVSGTFFQNNGTGSFTYGDDVETFGGSSCENVGFGYYSSASTTGYGNVSQRSQCPNNGITATETSTSVSDCDDSGLHTACVAGTYLPANSTTCTACPAGSYCEGGSYNSNYETAQGIKSCATEIGTGWNSDANATAETDCYYIVRLNKNGFDGFLSAGTGIGCSVVTTALRGVSTTTMKLYYDTECTLPGINLDEVTGYSTPAGWATTPDVGATPISVIPAMTETPTVTTYYVNKTACDVGYFKATDSTCEPCAAHSNNATANTLTGCACDTGYISPTAEPISSVACVAIVDTCEVGEYLPGGTTECTACPAGIWCPGGDFPASENDQGLTTNCAAGYYKSGNSCVACGANSTTENNNEAATCTCNDGYISETGTSTSVNGCLSTADTCEAGEYLPGGASACESCPIGSYCEGGSFGVNENDQGATPCPTGWTSAAGAGTINDCYYAITLDKNGFVGTVSANAGTGCDVAATATGTDNATLKLFYDTACTLPSVSFMQTGYTNANGWAATNTIGATAVTQIAATTTVPSTTTYYARKTTCGEDYYAANTTTCSACGANSSTAAANTASTCNCDTGYSADGTANGATTSTSGCLAKAVACPAGQYLPANASTCAQCPANNYCLGGTYDLSSSDSGATPCPNDLFAPAGMSKIAQCGRMLHIGDNVLYLHRERKTTPSFNVDIDNDGTADYWANMSTDPMTITANSERTFLVQYNNTTYYVYDDSAEAQGDKIDTGSGKVDTKFSVTTTNLAANDTFQFAIPAGGTFYVDCGEGGTLSGPGVSGKTITRSPVNIGMNNDNANLALYTCDYETGGRKTIKMAGTATEYVNNDYNSTIVFVSNLLVASVDGNLSAMFPYLGSEATQSPRFYMSFKNCSNLTSIPSTLFADYTQGCSKMFYAAFVGCSGLTEIPSTLFANITVGAPYMFTNAFGGCAGLQGYVPPSLFAGLIANNSPYESFMMIGIFNNSGFDDSCPTGTTQYTTGYESYWNGKVSCTPNGT